MPRKKKRKLTAAQKREKRRDRERYQTVLLNDKQKRIKREPLVEGMPADEFIEINADPLWLVQHGYHEILEARSNSNSCSDPAASEKEPEDPTF